MAVLCFATDDEILESVQRRALNIIAGGIVRTPTLNFYNENVVEDEYHVLCQCPL